MHIAIERIVKGALARSLLDTHRTLFQPLDELAIQEQSLTDDLFLELLAHPDVLEFIGWTDDGRPDGLMLATNNLTLVPWINPSFVERLHPEKAAKGLVYYVPCLQVHPDSQGGPIIRAIIESFSHFLGDRLGVLVFDSCQWDIDNLGVPQFVAKWAERYVEVETTEIDAQRYFAYDVTGKKVVDLRDRPDESVVIDLTEPALDATRTEV